MQRSARNRVTRVPADGSSRLQVRACATTVLKDSTQLLMASRVAQRARPAGLLPRGAQLVAPIAHRVAINPPLLAMNMNLVLLAFFQPRWEQSSCLKCTSEIGSEYDSPTGATKSFWFFDVINLARRLTRDVKDSRAERGQRYH